MRILVLGLFAVFILSALNIQSVLSESDTPTQGNRKPKQGNRNPSVIAIKFHADWCGSCRRMGSVFEDLTTVTEEEPVLFVRLDLTDRSSRKQAQYLMSMLNLQHVWEQFGTGQKTGFILLVDVDSRRALEKLTAGHDLKQMKAVLAGVLENG